MKAQASTVPLLFGLMSAPHRISIFGISNAYLCNGRTRSNLLAKAFSGLLKDEL